MTGAYTEFLTGSTQMRRAWIEDRYNRRRRHSSIGQISPVTFEMNTATRLRPIKKPHNPVSTVRGQGQPPQRSTSETHPSPTPEI
jgi:hypothetical protein